MTLNCIKLGRAVPFMKYLASVVSSASNSLNLAELVVNEEYLQK